MAAAQLLRRAIPDHHHLNKTLVQAAIYSLARRPCHTTTNSESPHPITKPPSTPTTQVDNKPFFLSPKQNKKTKWFKSDHLGFGPRYLACLVHDILHSTRYKDGERLTSADEKMVVEKLLAYHPHSEDKIGCGIDYIMVDRHPYYRYARCLFVVRTDGGVIDFSYKKCIQAYKRSWSC